MNRNRERGTIHGVLARYGVSRETCAHYAMLVEALLTDGVDEIQRQRLSEDEIDGPGPAVRALREGGMWPERSLWRSIEEQAQARKLKPADIIDATRAWLLNGNRRNDIVGAFDWAQSGKRSNRGDMVQRPGQPASQRRYLPDDPSAL